jgi:UDP-N-acetylglucosamine--N-acetylmuramyl-(pentapeptide) pyrophosphoryl-undecaprenol N-acetylglucosamine transferase
MNDVTGIPQARSPSKRLKLCLAASGGGHLRQLFDLEPGWSDHDSFFVTEHSVLGAGLTDRHRVHFVRHYAFGQVRMGKPFSMIWNLIGNFFQSMSIIWRERPDFVITTGAAAVFWVCLFARMTGARLVVIESFARFDAPSVFGRLTRRFATDLVIQSEALKAIWPDAHLFDPFRIVKGTPPPKRAFTLATVGATLPFDRMVQAVEDAWHKGAITGQLLVQVGDSKRHWQADPDNGLEIVATLSFEMLQQMLKDADIVIAHGGTGSLITALREGCRVVAMPRRHDLAEVYDNHQIEIVETFERRGLVDVAMNADDLVPALERARKRERIMATTQPDELISWLKQVMAETVAAAR